MKTKLVSICGLTLALIGVTGCETMPFNAGSQQAPTQTSQQTTQKEQIPDKNLITYQFEIPIDNKNGILKDKSTGLEWRRCALGRKWESATLTCKGEPTKTMWTDMVKLISKEKYAGHSDWRLPSAEEYKTLIKADKYTSCNQKRNPIKEFFPSIYSPNMFGSNHWLADNSTDFTNPLSADLELTQGMGGCPATEDSLRTHSKQPAIMVRGNPVSKEWKLALASLKNAKAINQKSIKDGREYWSGINKTVENFLGNRSSSGSSSVNVPGNSDAGNKNFTCEYYCAEGNALYGYSSTPSTSTSVAAKNKSEAESVLMKVLKEKNVCKGVKGDNGLSLSEKVKCRD